MNNPVQYGACALHARSLKAADTHSEYIVLLFHGNSVYEKVIHCYVVRTFGCGGDPSTISFTDAKLCYKYTYY